MSTPYTYTLTIPRGSAVSTSWSRQEDRPSPCSRLAFNLGNVKNSRPAWSKNFDCSYLRRCYLDVMKRSINFSSFLFCFIPRESQCAFMNVAPTTVFFFFRCCYSNLYKPQACFKQSFHLLDLSGELLPLNDSISYCPYN